MVNSSGTAAAAGLCGAGLVFGLLSHLGGLIPWPVGISVDSEPIAVAVHAGGGLCALGLGVGALAGQRLAILAAARHPFVLLPGALAIWSLVSALTLAGNPALALLGAPQTAEGPLLLCDQALFVAAALWLSRMPVAIRCVAWIGLGAAIFFPLLMLHPGARVYFFGAWQVYLVISAPVVAACFLVGSSSKGDGSARHPVWRRSARLAPPLGATAALVTGLATSGSYTAIAAGLAILPVLGWLWGDAVYSFISPHGGRRIPGGSQNVGQFPMRGDVNGYDAVGRNWGWLWARALNLHSPTAANQTAPRGAMTGRPLVWLAQHPRWGFAVLALVVILALGVASWLVGQSRTLESVWSRVHLQQALLADFLGSGTVFSWCFGVGWGQIGDLFARSVLAAGIPIWSGPTHWDMLGRDVVNSHNFVLDALLAGGVPGCALRLAMVIGLPLWARTDRVWAAGLFAISYAVLASLWFQLPGVVAMVALAVAGLAGPQTAGRIRQQRQSMRACFRFLRKLSIYKSNCVANISCGASGADQSKIRGEANGYFKSLVVFLSAGVWIALGVGLVAVSARLYREGVEIGRVSQILLGTTPPVLTVVCDGTVVPGWRGDVYLGELLVRTLKIARRAPEAVSEGRLSVLRSLMCLAERPQHRASPWLQTFLMAAYADSLWIPGYAAGRHAALFTGLEAKWEPLVINYLKIAPARGDLIGSYLLWLARERGATAVTAAAARILAVAPDEPVTLWYSGAVMTHTSEPQERHAGFLRLRQALAAGVDLRIVIPEDSRRLVLEYSGRASD